MIDLSQIPLLTPEEAESYANALTKRQRYEKAIEELRKQAFIDIDTIEAITRYTEDVLRRLVEARNEASRLRYGDT